MKDKNNDGTARFRSAPGLATAIADLETQIRENSTKQSEEIADLRNAINRLHVASPLNLTC
ncbi:hypothetical protein AUC69_12465 [Methyloceanibacter superfactus]|uniref:Uncharacterized protein n=1 Tax=Methyloceanibacter superfactus TaxID=1774969 RepID=A0A1E3VV71_9HYPH|nr:hypothetical protein AUC69_12465 [Methyloceanibacter superfactus]